MSADSSSAAPATALDDDDFCAVARELDENNPFDDPEIGLFSEEFFTVTVEFYEGVAAIAPDAIRGDVQYVLGAITELGAIADQYQYNLFDPAFAEAIESFNTTELEAAGTRIEAYLAAECGIDIGGGASAETGPAVPDALDGAFGDALDGMDLDDLDDEDLAALNDLFISQFNISPELAQCLATELDDLEAALEDPQILNRPICGTTLLQIISGINTGG